MNWHERFKAMKSGLGLTNSDIADITGNSADSVKSVSDEDLGNRSKYIEKLIREDMSTRGKNTNKF